LQQQHSTRKRSDAGQLIIVLMNVMKYLVFLLALMMTAFGAYAQDDTTTDSSNSTTYVTIHKDPRLYTLAKKELVFNQVAATSTKAAKGYRLMVLNTNNRALALKTRASLLQHYPDQKVYMIYQSPYIKLKFGDFMDKDDADDYKSKITNAKIVTGNIYIVPETIEVEPDKTSTPAQSDN
jgi:hypothetical protein